MYIYVSTILETLERGVPGYLGSRDAPFMSPGERLLTFQGGHVDYDFRICSLFGCINGKWAGVYVALLVSVPKRVLIGGGPYIVIRITEN